MRFLYLTDIKVKKEFNYSTITLDLEISFNDGLKTMQEKAQKVLKPLFSRDVTALETLFYINLIVTDAPSDSGEKEDFFLTFTNVFMAEFFNNICLDAGRPRERRLDVPERLKAASNISCSLLKQAVNSKTVFDTFNVQIEWNDNGSILGYNLIDQDKEIASDKLISAASVVRED